MASQAALAVIVGSNRGIGLQVDDIALATRQLLPISWPAAPFLIFFSNNVVL